MGRGAARQATRDGAGRRGPHRDPRSLPVQPALPHRPSQRAMDRRGPRLQERHPGGRPAGPARRARRRRRDRGRQHAVRVPRGRAGSTRRSTSTRPWSRRASREPTLAAGLASACTHMAGPGARRPPSRCSSSARPAPARRWSRARSTRCRGAAGAVRRGQLRRAARDAGRERAVRLRARRVLRRASRDRPGLVRAADGGTLFLDEIGELPRGVAGGAPARPAGARGDAGRRDRAGAGRPARRRRHAPRPRRPMVARRRFRADLSRACAASRVALPPLRERREDLGCSLAAACSRRAAPAATRLRLRARRRARAASATTGRSTCASWSRRSRRRWCSPRRRSRSTLPHLPEPIAARPRARLGERRGGRTRAAARARGAAPADGAPARARRQRLRGGARARHHAHADPPLGPALRPRPGGVSLR